MKKLLAVMIVIFLVGCGITVKNDVCDTEQESTLCVAADKLGVSLGEIAIGLKLGNIGGLASDLYTAKQALKFIDELNKSVDLIEGFGGNYKNFVESVLSKYRLMSPEVQALFMVVSIDLEIPELSMNLLTDYDIYLMRKHLKEQELIIAPFAK